MYLVLITVLILGTHIDFAYVEPKTGKNKDSIKIFATDNRTLC